MLAQNKISLWLINMIQKYFSREIFGLLLRQSYNFFFSSSIHALTCFIPSLYTSLYGTLYDKFPNFYCNLFSESFQQTNQKIKFFHLILRSSILMVSRMEIFLGKSDINQSLSRIERIWYRKYDHNFEIYQNDDLYVIQKMLPSQIN